MTKYKDIQLALERAIASAQEELAFLMKVKADQGLIDSLQADIAFINEASEIVWQYKELES